MSENAIKAAIIEGDEHIFDLLDSISVLLSIKPENVEKIISGEKKFEFRKKIWKRELIKIVFLYSSTPIRKIIGYFFIDKIIKGNPETIWHYCQEGAGITEEVFFRYFEGKSLAYAIRIGNLRIFDNPINPLETIKDFKAPQSFMYLELER